MHAVLTRLLLVITLLVTNNVVLGSTTTSLPALRKSNNVRMLRSHSKTDQNNDKISASTDVTTNTNDEERLAISDAVKKMTSDTKNWQKTIKLKMMVRHESIFANKKAIVQRYMDLKVNPDQVYKWLKLDKESRRFNQGVATPNYKLWKLHKDAWVEKFPDLASKLKFS